MNPVPPINNILRGLEVYFLSCVLSAVGSVGGIPRARAPYVVAERSMKSRLEGVIAILPRLELQAIDITFEFADHYDIDG